MRKKFKIKVNPKDKVAIRAKFCKRLPFLGFNSRNVSATVMSYYGDRDDVYRLLQRASHTTRAYLYNANGLKGFLVKGIVA